ncbi:PREDICTED: uncharacterized protein C4orf45 homolog [Amphimedon queenslandica]|uniref:Uncharacterized protein n=1 Tax=Amphimedon queenslandica TaxID=400682 RepID=A0AAN0IB79_AMPQE|nr:PREDICTED: uncharacterized protein C4orf45 homolog [Amphimedon queenslandica]|eukprot:XP_003384451.1 PREDICTED: uncharacterized protein C4orf45 homolog [Amphimedon queenslandica]
MSSSETGTVVSSVELPDEKPKAKGAVLFTGPDGIGDYKVNVQDHFYVGHGAMSSEATSNTTYLCRASTDTPHPPPKSLRVGEVGWGVPGNADYSLLKTGNQIILKEFRGRTEERYTHRFQEPYYPPPSASMHPQAQDLESVSNDSMQSVAKQ